MKKYLSAVIGGFLLSTMLTAQTFAQITRSTLAHRRCGTILKTSSAAFTVYNALGKTVLVKQVSNLSNNNEIKLDMDNTPEGIYFVKMEAAEGTIIKKIVIAK